MKKLLLLTFLLPVFGFSQVKIGQVDVTAIVNVDSTKILYESNGILKRAYNIDLGRNKVNKDKYSIDSASFMSHGSSLDTATYRASILAQVRQLINDSLNANQLILKGSQFAKNGDTVSIIGYNGSLTQLSPPSLSATAIDTASISVVLGSVSNATSYQLDTATTNAGPWGNIATTPGTYTRVGLTSATPYYYRARAIGDGSTYSNSSYATANATTSSSGGGGGGSLVDVTSWPNNSGFTITGNNLFSTGNGSIAASASKMANGVDGTVRMTADLTSGTSGTLCLSRTSASQTLSNIDYAVLVYGNQVWTAPNGSYTNSNISAAQGDIIQWRKSGTNLILEKSSNGGSTFGTPIVTVSVVSGDLYVKAVADNGYKLSNIQGINLQ